MLRTQKKKARKAAPIPGRPKGPQLNRAYRPAMDSQKRFIVLKGGAGSGKSVFCAQKILHRCKFEHKRFVYASDGVIINVENYAFAHRFLVVRKVAATRRNSVYNLIQGEINKQGLQKEWRGYTGDLRFVHLPTGAEILTVGIDDSEKLKSIADITGIWIEEATELVEQDFLQLNLRLRGNYPYYKQFLISFNPVSASHWLCKYFDTIGGPYTNPEKTDLYHTTFKHNHYTDADYRAQLENLVKVDENLARIYLYGEWGIENPNKLFAKDFRKEKHVSKKAVYDPNLGQVWLSFDFNIKNTCIIAQKTERYVHILKEYHYDGGDLQDLAFEVRTDLRKMKCEALGIDASEYQEDYITINADASGGNRSGSSMDRQSAHEQLAKYFGGRNGDWLGWEHFNVPGANPPHGSSRLVTNMVLKNEPEFLIHPSCKLLLQDLEQVLFLNGGIDKSNDELTHLLDAFRYFVWAELHILDKRLDSYGLAPIAEKLTKDMHAYTD